jgi:hypothetical protein
MKKLFVWALLATLLVAGSAFAAGTRAGSFETRNASTFLTGNPTTTNNDDSCEVGMVMPAATLLLPYFEVDINSPATTATTTLFTITNTSRQPQIAHVTLWTDWSYPVIDFNIFLTGYDVQAINLYDIIARGLVAPDKGTSNATTPGSRSASNLTGNPLFDIPGAAASCSPAAMGGGVVPADLLADLRSGLTTGIYSLCPGERIGGTHANAIGYATIDTARTCSQTLPTDPLYFTNEILFENVLIGDYQQINPNPTTGNYAQGNPLVHIKAIPEGGLPGVGAPTTNLPYTFYDRYTPAANRKADRRVPLPSVFAARYIQGGTSGFATNFKIWREGVTSGSATCDLYIDNSTLAIVESVRFDERENPTTISGGCSFSPCRTSTITLPETSATPSSSAKFPPLTSGDVAGWMYLNLNNNNTSGTYSSPAGFTPVRASQNWVIVSMFAEGRYSVDYDAAHLANGCTPAALSPTATTSTGANPIGPGPNVTP